VQVHLPHRELGRRAVLEIVVRVVGDSGNDVLADSAGGKGTFFYDAEGANQYVMANGTHLSERPWSAPEDVFGFTLGGAWRPDRSGVVKVTVLGPKPGSKQPPITQVAAEMSAKSDLLESALWVDGTELLEKGGGLTPRRGTLYGAPAKALAPGTHTAVAYARTATHGTAVAWTFRV
jgi:hypothetical protein